MKHLIPCLALLLACGGSDPVADAGTDARGTDVGVVDTIQPQDTGGTDTASNDTATADTNTQPMGNGMCPTGACDLLDVDSCAGADMACIPDNGSVTCATVGTVADGQPCTGSTECAPGLLCDTGAGVCRKICCLGDDAPCGAGSSCGIFIGGYAGPEVPGLCVANRECDPAAQDCSIGTDGCYPASVDGNSFTRCQPAGTAARGTACSASNDCVAGDFCVSVGGTAECYQYCAPSAPNCDGGLTCNALTGAPNDGFCS